MVESITYSTSPIFLDLSKDIALHSCMPIMSIEQPQQIKIRERSGSVVECLTRDQWAAGSSLTNITELCP